MPRRTRQRTMSEIASGASEKAPSAMPYRSEGDHVESLSRIGLAGGLGRHRDPREYCGHGTGATAAVDATHSLRLLLLGGFDRPIRDESVKLPPSAPQLISPLARTSRDADSRRRHMTRVGRCAGAHVPTHNATATGPRDSTSRVHQRARVTRWIGLKPVAHCIDLNRRLITDIPPMDQKSTIRLNGGQGAGGRPMAQLFERVSRVRSRAASRQHIPGSRRRRCSCASSDSPKRSRRAVPAGANQPAADLLQHALSMLSRPHVRQLHQMPTRLFCLRNDR